MPYYALVSFAGFQNFVDELGGVTVDVPERLVDYEFPDVNMK
ncbi:MAG: LCP family protein [Candidatus Peribacteria bacterium]|nr:MAG: LCP family protein [Candidatus Peribacteria bacterium]